MHSLYTVYETITSLLKKIKNRSYNIIYTFKNYFIIIFLIFNF